MKICVFVKQVPDQGSVLKINDDSTWIKEDNLVFTTNESDNYALEEALLIKEQQGGEVVVVSMGPERAIQVLKDALAKGADRAIFIDDPSLQNLDIMGQGIVFAAAVKDEEFDLVLCGLQADDTGEAQLGPILADQLNLPHVTLVVHTEMHDNTAKVKQELESGWFQNVEVDLPAVLAIQSGLNKPRYASLRGIMGMKSKEIKQVTAADLGIDTAEIAPLQSIESIYLPPKTKETVFIEGSPDEIVAELIDQLTNVAKVL